MIINANIALPQLTSCTWLSAKKNTGIKRKENGRRNNTMVSLRSIGQDNEFVFFSGYICQNMIIHLFYPFFYLLSRLPFPILYLLSDVMYVAIYHIAGYRKKVVLQNLRNSFPEKTDEEIKKITKAFYHHFCDLFLETFKMLTISPKAMLKHCPMSKSTQELFAGLAAQNRNCILVLGHLGNWEWAGPSFSLSCPQPLYIIYHKLTNKYFDRLMYKIRSRFGPKLIEMNDTLRAMMNKRNELNATVFVSDQTPLPQNASWTTFLNQDTPVFVGAEKISRKLNYPVVYMCIKKHRRGYYEVLGEMLVENPSQTKEGEITELHTRRLEKDIIAYPETWLWTHRRWKHKRVV